MHYDLMRLKSSMDMTTYSLKDLALYFEKFDGYICEITTNRGKLRFKFTTSSLPHMIGLQYAFENRKDKRSYMGKSGFEKLKNGEITYELVKSNIKRNNKLKIAWRNIDERIRYLPMFLNSIQNKTKLKTAIQISNESERYTRMKGSYFLYRQLHDGSTPILSLKKVSRSGLFIETFVVDDDESIIKNLQEIKIKNVKLIDPLKNTEPIIDKEKITE